jgi:predicted Zn finger-like uncharacterized protein
MLIVCPNCATSYQVEPSALGAAGRSVRCVRCRNIWFAHDPSGLTAIAQAHRADLAAFTPEGPPPAADAAMAEAADGAVPAAEAGTMAQASGAEASTAEEGWGNALPQAAEPIAVDDAPALAPMEQGGASLPADPPAEDIETLAARRYPDRNAGAWRRWLPSGLPLAILALLALDTALIAWRADVVRVAPQTASLYAAIGLPVNVRGLAFSNVTSTTEPQDGVQVLLVEGTIASVSPRIVEIPRLRFAIRNAAGQEVYAWTALPERSMLAPGETLAFHSRLASPPPDGHDVLVRFFNRRDLVAGLR